MAAACGADPGSFATTEPHQPDSSYTLTCQSMVNPMGVDNPNPVLGWIYQTAEKGYRQSAYQIRVASSRALLQVGMADIWQSDRVFSAACVQVPYTGPPLQSLRDYFWQVRVWNQHGAAAAWSPIAKWTMGVMNPLEWRAEWITSPIMENVHEPRTIIGWKCPPATVRHRRTFYRISFERHQLPCFYRIYVAAAGRGVAYLNGVRIARHLKNGTMRCIIGQKHIRPGRNVLAIEIAPHPRSDVAAGITCIMPGGHRDMLPLHYWKCHSAQQSGWQMPTFNDSRWKRCVDSYPFGSQPWASPDMSFDAPRRSFMLRREFYLSKTVQRAVVMVSGLGCYELRLNGHKVGGYILSPDWTQYSRRTSYDMFDVTALLFTGANCIGAILGNSWWSSGLGPTQSLRAAAPDDNLKMLCQLHLEYTDGSHQVLCSDGNWKVHPSPIVADSIYNGEIYDARLEMPGWDQPDFDAGNWYAAQSAQVDGGLLFSPRADEPIQIVGTLAPQRITEPTSGIYVLDFGQNHAGVTQIRVQEQAGSTITLHHAESIYPDGRVDRRNLQSARATDTYICRGGGVETWMPRFTYHGYRYVEVHGLTHRPARSDFTAMIFSIAAQNASAFSCSNATYNQADRMARWSQRSNLISVPTDCPQRDSRMGSMGDAAAFVRTACWNQLLPAFYRKWSRDMADAATTDLPGPVHPTGPPTIIAPTVGRVPRGYPGWADAVTIVPYTSFIFHNDLLGLQAAYPLMCQWAHYLFDHRTGGVFIHPTFGDWLALAPTPADLISAAWACRSMQIVAKTAKWINPLEAMQWESKCHQMAAAFNARFLDRRTLQYGNGSQCSNILPLAFDLAPSGACRSVLQNIVQDITARGGQLTTGYLATPHLLPVLSRYGQFRLAAQLLAETRYPSLGYMAQKGCTTVAERWDFDRCGPRVNSLNHTVFGSLTAWLYEYLAGIAPDEAYPGFRRFFARPQFPAGMTFLNFHYASPHGRIICRWRRKRRDIHMQLVVPPGSDAELHFISARTGFSQITADGHDIYRQGVAQDVRHVKVLDANAGRPKYQFAAGDWRLHLREL